MGGVIPPKPWILSLCEDIQRYGVLWAAGGLEDQPHYLWRDIQLAESIWASIQTKGQQGGNQ